MCDSDCLYYVAAYFECIDLLIPPSIFSHITVVGRSPFLRSYSHVVRTRITISVSFNSCPTQISIDRSYFMTSALNFTLIVFDSVAYHSKMFTRTHSILVPSRSSLSHVHRSSFTSAYSFSFSYCSSLFDFNFYITCHMLCHLKQLGPSMRTYPRRTSLTFLMSCFTSLICLELFRYSLASPRVHSKPRLVNLTGNMFLLSSSC
jgi:hypothetical protein